MSVKRNVLQCYKCYSNKHLWHDMPKLCTSCYRGAQRCARRGAGPIATGAWVSRGFLGNGSGIRHFQTRESLGRCGISMCSNRSGQVPSGYQIRKKQVFRMGFESFPGRSCSYSHDVWGMGDGVGNFLQLPHLLFFVRILNFICCR